MTGPSRAGDPKLTIRHKGTLLRARLRDGRVGDREHKRVCDGLVKRGLAEQLGFRHYVLTPAGRALAEELATTLATSGVAAVRDETWRPGS